MDDHIGISLAAIGVSLTILELFLIILFSAISFFGYSEIRGMKRKTQETIRETMQDEIKNFMESKAGKRLLDETSNATTPANESPDEREEDTK